MAVKALTGEQLFLFTEKEERPEQLFFDFDKKPESTTDKIYRLTAFNHNEAAVIAVSQRLAKKANFSGLDMRVVNIALWEMNATRELFPKLPVIDFIGERKAFREEIKTIKAEIHFSHMAGYYREKFPTLSDAEILTKIKKEQKGKCKTHKEALMSFIHYSTLGKNLLYINGLFYSANAYERTIAEKYNETQKNFHPEKCLSAKSDFAHEIGHYLTFVLNLDESTLIKLYHELKASGKIEKELSKYGTINPMEFIAEAWSEYRCNPNPREVALKVANTIIEKYHAEYDA